MRAILLLPILIVSHCVMGDAPSPPMCRIDKTYLETVTGSAGCIIRSGKALLTITHRLSHKYAIPGGKSNGETESAQCTAHRKTWEKTGFNVEIGPLLGINEDQFRYYACELDDDFDGEMLTFPTPDWTEDKVESIQLIDPFDTQHFHWRFPDRLILLRDMFNDLGKIQHQSTQQTAQTQHLTDWQKPVPSRSDK